MNRFCHQLGFERYKDFCLALAMELGSSNPLLPTGQITPEDSPLEIARKVLQADIQAIYDTLMMLDAKSLEAALEANLLTIQNRQRQPTPTAQTETHTASGGVARAYCPAFRLTVPEKPLPLPPPVPEEVKAILARMLRRLSARFQAMVAPLPEDGLEALQRSATPALHRRRPPTPAEVPPRRGGDGVLLAGDEALQ